MYQLEGRKLRVCASYLREERNRIAMAQARVVILEHILPTTEAFIHQLHEAGAEVFAVVAKPYSIDDHVARRLEQAGHRLERKSYAELEDSRFLDELLAAAVKRSELDSRRIIIVDVGGYFAAPLTRLTQDASVHLAGAVEDTTFGHNRYLTQVASIKMPVISVARSALKEMEAHFVGRDAVHAVDSVLRGLGVSMTGRHAVVIGYGMIGRSVARALQAHDLNVSVYDVRDHRNLEAFMSGFNVDKKARLLRSADIVFAATGWSASLAVIDSHTGDLVRVPAVSKQEILEFLSDNVVLASVGSKDNEFDMVAIRELSVEPPNELGPHIRKYKLPNGDAVWVIKEGTAVNFLEPSIPVEVLDLVFSEILLAMIFLLKVPNQYPAGSLHAVPEKYVSYIAKDWLRFSNPKK